MLSQTEENYLKHLLHFGMQEGNTKGISSRQLADKLEVKASSVNDMLKKLKEKNLVQFEPYGKLFLTREGEQMAVQIIRKHRLWETFLVNKLKFNWADVHEIAEQLEHIQSVHLMDKLDEFLDFPTVDPHGDPIPTREGLFKDDQRISLGEVELYTLVKIVGVKEDSPSFLNYLDKLKIQIGAVIELLAKEEFDESYQIKHGERTLHVSQKFVENLWVIPTSQG